MILFVNNTKWCTALLITLNGYSALFGQALGGTLELKRNFNKVTAEARISFKCCPLPVLNYFRINWGDGSPTDSIPLLQIVSGAVPNYSFMYFSGDHTFTPNGVFTVTAGDINFAPAITNIPNPSNFKLKLRGMIDLTLPATPPSSPFFYNLIDTVPCNLIHYNDFVSNHGMQSAEGDSLGYSLDLHQEIVGYIPPPISVDSYGTITFSANASGNYNVSLRTDAWRKLASSPTFSIHAGSTYREIYLAVCNVYLPWFTSVEEINLTVGLKCFPNPATDFIYITSSQSNSDSLKNLLIYNHLGQLIRQQEIIITSNKTQINVSELSNGIYFIGLYTSSGHVINKRIVISR